MDNTLLAGGDKVAQFIAWLINPATQMLMAPMIGCLIIMMIPRTKLTAIRFTAVATAALTALISLMMVVGINPASPLMSIPLLSGYLRFVPDSPSNFQFYQSVPWMQIRLGEFQSWGVNYEVGVDGLSMPLILMSTFVMLLAVVWALPRTERVREFFALTLFMEVGLLGSFIALDYVLLYLFWEWMLIPMYFLIAGWGRDKEKSARAAMKFFIYTLFGSVIMLITFIAMQVFTAGQVHTFSIPGMQAFWLSDLANAQQSGLPSVLPQVRMLMFIGLLLGFVVKAPMFPFHTWLPDAHSEAPTEMSVILAAIMLKTGTYAMLRTLYPSFPDVAYLLGPIIAACGVIAIVYGALVTLVQVDLKRMVAYSSISHMGFIILGFAALNSDPTMGTIFHMVGHGIIITAMFFLVGLIERRYGTRNLHELAGLMQISRGHGLALAVTAFAGMGFPGLVGFWGELFIIKGAFYNNPNWQSVSVGSLEGARFLQIMAILAIVGILTSAVYMINMLQRVLPGDAPKPVEGWQGFRLTEGLVLAPLVLCIIILGLYPQGILHWSSQWALYLQQLYLLF